MQPHSYTVAMKLFTLLFSLLISNLGFGQSVFRISLPLNASEYAQEILRLPSGSYLLGTISGASDPYNEKCYLVSRKGKVVSENLLGLFDRPYLGNMLRGSSGRLFMGSNSSDYASNYIAKAREIDSMGNILWEKFLSDSLYSIATPLAQSGQAIYAGVQEKRVAPYEYNNKPIFFITKLDLTGSIIWKSYVADSSSESMSQISVLNDDRIVLALNDVQGNLLAVCIDSSGNIIWKNSYPSIDYYRINDIAVENEKLVVTTLERGTPNPTSSAIGIHTIDIGGNPILAKSFTLPFTNVFKILNRNPRTSIVVTNSLIFNPGVFTPQDTISQILQVDSIGQIESAFVVKNLSHTEPYLNNVIMLDSNTLCLNVSLSNGPFFYKETITKSELIEINLADTLRSEIVHGFKIISMPNPTENDFSITILPAALPGNLQITDTNGGVVMELAIDTTITPIIASSLNGLYFIKYQSRDGNYTATSKILVRGY